MSKIIKFADWEIGPIESFDRRWADQRFEERAKAFVKKFVDRAGKPVQRPSLLCRPDGQLDGRLPKPEEIEALRAAIAFAFLDENPRCTSSNSTHGEKVRTADNTELFVWPIDVEKGYVTVTTGLIVQVFGGGYRIDDPDLVIRPPLDLDFPLGAGDADSVCLEAVYKTVLCSVQNPGVNQSKDRIKIAINWFVKAWRNTATVDFPERVVFLKTAFEALTGTSDSRDSARKLRELFEAIPDASADDAKRLLWSPEEKEDVRLEFTKNGKQQTKCVTNLEHWFMAFADARNKIVHEGAVPCLNYVNQSNPRYGGPFFWTAEYLLRAAVKVSLFNHGFTDLWRSPLWRFITQTYDQLEAQEPSE